MKKETLYYADLDETPATYQLSSQTLNARIQSLTQIVPPQQSHMLSNASQQLYFGQPNSRPSRPQLTGLPDGKIMPNGVLMQHQMAIAKPDSLNVIGGISISNPSGKPVEPSASTANIPTSSTNLPPTTSS